MEEVRESSLRESRGLERVRESRKCETEWERKRERGDGSVCERYR